MVLTRRHTHANAQAHAYTCTQVRVYGFRDYSGPYHYYEPAEGAAAGAGGGEP